MKRALAIALAMLIAAPALANPPPKANKGHKGSASGDDDDDDDDDTATKPKPDKGSASDSDSGDDDDDDDDDSGSAKAKAKPSEEAAPATAATTEEMQKQDLTGHDMGTSKKTTAEEKDRFFVDKVDTAKTKNGTLVQGSLTLSAFFYSESGGPYGNAGAQTIGNDTTAPSIYWTDLRLQTDFRHIGGGQWDGRVDFRARFVNTPNNDIGGTFIPNVSTPPNLVQSGLLGENEYDLRELWLIRNGVSTDLIFGRQFIPDLGGVKIDGLRVDYASSQKFTYLGFAGLYPLRGSRSLSSDYGDSYDDTGKDLGRVFTGAGGFGGAYRTQQAYGSFGGVALVPFAQEPARIFATSTGYWRVNPLLDFYHFAIIDVISSYGAQLTNLSLGLNYKPTQRLRLTASFNRNDVDTLNIQAANFFTNQNNPAPTGLVLNEIYVQRIAANEARTSISAGLGPDERFQLTASLAYRERPDFTMALTGATTAPLSVPIAAAQSVEVYGSFTDRHSVANLRLGIDGLDTFAVGDTPYDRVDYYSMRVFAGRELLSGKGEWETELSYSSSKDDNGTKYGAACSMVFDCFGASTNSVISFGGTFYYRLNRDWFTILSAYLEHTAVHATLPTPGGDDAAINGITGFGRIAYRF